ncbi:GMC oxidoreductase [Viridothelium virens]|uniref:GMC oxidoreductase n=1 Tax=Viridothelium virens TaxID=1048519 RepID=A0A6A6HN95_VIRVR|nr:GMC oxidoreductase [Viridothelium virens]
MQPGMNWAYKTTPQSQLNSREIDYSRGKGLGGSSAINFAVWTLGPKHDYDEWARQVGDPAFNWPNTRRRFDDIENINLKVDQKYQKYFQPLAGDHGNRGRVHVECPPIWEKGMTEVADAAEEFGFPINKDINSGDPIGIGLFPSTSKGGIRNTAADAFLSDPPANLKIQINSPVHRISFEGTHAVGVEVEGNRHYTAIKEIILCAGALDSPKLLKLSGIGPRSELTQHHLPCISDLPGVGANLQDHLYAPLTLHLKPGLDDRPALFSSPTALANARTAFRTSRSGPLAHMLHTSLIYSLRHSDLSSDAAFQQLPASTQQHVLAPTVPHFEMSSQSPPLIPLPQDRSYFTVLVFFFHPQSRGSVTLASADPTAAPVCDGRFLTEEFDRVMVVRGVGAAMEFVRSPRVAERCDGVVQVPRGESEEEILEYVRENCGTSWHMTGTARMEVKGSGGQEDKMGVVDTGFRVKGVQGLRVADMSVMPFVPNCHTQAVAYQIGAIAAEKLCAEYGLN